MLPETIVRHTQRPAPAFWVQQMFNSTRELDSGVGTMEHGSINRSVSPTPMPEQEAYRPQAEHSAEQPQNRPTPEAGATKARPENEVAANPRILALMQERDAAERRLQEAILDLETREQSPAFQIAKDLFDNRNRLSVKNLDDDGVLRFSLSRQDNQSGTIKVYHYGLTDWDENNLRSYDERESLPGDLGQKTISKEMLQYLLDLTQENKMP